MADLGLVDHLIGGFFRYATDTDWAMPHFEKMLYDNVNLALLYLNAGKVLGSAKYESIGQQTLVYMQKYMWRRPVPSAVLISTSLELAKKFSDDGLKEQALSALNRSETLLMRAPFWYVSQLEARSLALEN